MIVSAFGLAGRLAGDLLDSALGWASSLLFGRVPGAHRRYLTLMMAGSLAWMLVIVGLLLPAIASLLIAWTPHPGFMDARWLRTAMLAGFVGLPLGVGFAGTLVPSDQERPRGFRLLGGILRGYLLAPVIGGLLIFLAGVGIARKIRSGRHGWSDVHVPIVVVPGEYEEMVEDLRDALIGADLPVSTRDAPRVLTFPAWVLIHVAGSGIAKGRPDRLVELCAPGLRIGVYPSDIAISGDDRQRTRARAAVLSRLATSAAHLTTTAEAQEVEDRLAELARTGPSGYRTATQRAFDPIDRRLLELTVPTDEWDVLYRLRLQIERDLLAELDPGRPRPRPPFQGRDAGPVPAARMDRSLSTPS